MKIEREVKVLGIDIEALRHRLVSFRARLVFKGIIHEVAFTSEELKRKRITLRLRVANGRNELTLKRKKKKTGRLLVRPEYEVTVSDFNETVLILEALGFSKIRDREKEREEWILGGTKIEIDRYPGMPLYAEIEARDEKTILSYVRKLGLSKLRRSSQTSTELLKAWGVKDPNRLRF